MGLGLQKLLPGLNPQQLNNFCKGLCPGFELSTLILLANKWCRLWAWLAKFTSNSIPSGIQ